MRLGGWLTCGIVGGWVVLTLGGCVSIEKYQRLQAAHRMVQAQNEQIERDLQDERSVTDTLRTRADSLEREMGTNNELLTNYRTESDLLNEMLETCRRELERVAGLQKFEGVAIAGPKLPEALDDALETFAEAHPGDVIYDAINGTVKWKSDLLFAIGSDLVTNASLASLEAFVGVLKSPAATGFEVLVVGHTDTKTLTPTTQKKHPTNWHLSTHRAIAVKSALLKYGYSAERITVAGCGEFRPVATNADETGATQNRRVEIYLVPVGSIIDGAVKPNP